MTRSNSQPRRARHYLASLAAAGVMLASLANASALAAAPPMTLPAPEPTPQASPLALPAAPETAATPAPTPEQAPPTMATPRPTVPAPNPAPTPFAPQATLAAPVAEETAPAVDPGFGDDLALPSEARDAVPSTPESSAVGASILPASWPWIAGALAAIAAMFGLLIALRRRKPTAPRLATPVPATASSAEADAAPLRVDCQLDIISAARSVMMFSIDYRLEIANRSDRAVRDLAITIRLGYPGRTGEDAPLADTAQDSQIITRVGPHQSRTITGTLRLPLAVIVPIHQGAAPLLIPLLDITLESAGGQTDRRVFVAGTPSPANVGRLHPIRLDTPPGGIAGLKALPVTPA